MLVRILNCFLSWSDFKRITMMQCLASENSSNGRDCKQDGHGRMMVLPIIAMPVTVRWVSSWPLFGRSGCLS